MNTSFSSFLTQSLSGLRCFFSWPWVPERGSSACRDRAGGGGGKPAEGGGDGVREPEQDPQGAPPGGAPRRAMVAAQRAAQRLRHHHTHVQQLLRLLLINSSICWSIIMQQLLASRSTIASLTTSIYISRSRSPGWWSAVQMEDVRAESSWGLAVVDL